MFWGASLSSSIAILEVHKQNVAVYEEVIECWRASSAISLQELAHNGLGCGFGMGRVSGLMGAATGLCAQKRNIARTRR